MITFTDWFVPAVVGLSFTILGLLKLGGLYQGVVGGKDQPLHSATLWNLTYLGDGSLLMK